LASQISSQIGQIPRQIALSNASNGIRTGEYPYFCITSLLSHHHREFRVSNKHASIIGFLRLPNRNALAAVMKFANHLFLTFSMIKSIKR